MDDVPRVERSGGRERGLGEGRAHFVLPQCLVVGCVEPVTPVGPPPPRLDAFRDARGVSPEHDTDLWKVKTKLK